MNKHRSDYSDLDHGITRRKFLGAAAGGSAALLTGGLASLLKPTVSAAGFDFVEATIPKLQAAMASGALTSVGLTVGYINRIQSLNPTLHAVIEVNPNAAAIASGLDNERRAGHVRGPECGDSPAHPAVRSQKQHLRHGTPACLKNGVSSFFRATW